MDNKILPGVAYNESAIEAAARALKDQPLGSRAYLSADGSTVRIYAASVTRTAEVDQTEEREEKASPVTPFVDPLQFRTY